jgi:L-rhamnonate dehydratase
VKRRHFLQSGAILGLASAGTSTALGQPRRDSDDAGWDFPVPTPLDFIQQGSDLRITSLRAVELRPTNPLPSYEPAPGAWSTTQVEIANPMSIYPRFKPRRSLFFADDLSPTCVVVETNKGITGYGYGGPGAGYVIERHLPKLVVGEDPFRVERIWDIMWRGTLYYGRKGMVLHALSAVDNALWDIAGKALNLPVYQLLGGPARERTPCYCTGNDIEHAVEFGFRKIKLAIPHGPADGEEGLRINEQLVRRAREAVGEEGEVMLDCWMAFTAEYTEQLAQRLEPYRVYWMEECLMPDDYAGMRQVRQRIDSTRMATGEHEYTRYGFQLLADYEAADIWQPDMNWCGGLSELRWIDALARRYEIPVIPHGGWRGGGAHFVHANSNTPWCEMFLPPPGGPPAAYAQFEEQHGITRGPEGIYHQPPDRPGFGFEVEPVT